MKLTNKQLQQMLAEANGDSQPAGSAWHNQPVQTNIFDEIVNEIARCDLNVANCSLTISGEAYRGLNGAEFEALRGNFAFVVVDAAYPATQFLIVEARSSKGGAK